MDMQFNLQKGTLDQRIQGVKGSRGPEPTFLFYQNNGQEKSRHSLEFNPVHKAVDDRDDKQGE